MKYGKFLLITLIGVVVSSTTQAQIKNGDKAYEKTAYIKAIPYYENGLKKDSTNTSAWSKLADCYRRLGYSAKAEKAYKKAISGSTSNANDHYFYILSLIQNQHYVEANSEITQFKSKYPTDSRIAMLKECTSDLDDYLQKKGSYNVKSVNINGSSSDICPTPFAEGIVFISDRATLGWKKLVTSSTNRSFYQPYFAKGSDFSFEEAVPFKTSLANSYHAGPVAFNSDGKLMIITRTNKINGKAAKDGKGIVRLQLFTSALSEKGWGIEVPMPFNSQDYSCMHPTISADGKTLYFASDMPGSVGGLDIWQSNWDGSKWSSPTNLGNKINSIGDEVFPFIGESNILYFSSNGWPGLGGLDVYMSELQSSTSLTPMNLGSDINSGGDDFGFTFNNTTKKGYFSSNKNHQGIDDDIYSIEKLCVNATISVVDDETGKPVVGAVVKIMENGTEIGSVLTDETGSVSRCLNANANYEFVCQRDKFNENKISIASSKLASSIGNISETVKMTRIPDSVAHVEGRVFNADDKKGASGLTISLINKKSGETKTATTDADGKYRFEKLDINCDYEIRTKKTDCGEPIEPFNTKNIVGTKTITMDIPLLCKNDVIEIENIYYDYKKFDIRPDAAIELDKIVAILNKYPNMRIELRSHTDSRGNDNFNLKLSDDRANSAALYIIGKGIESKRIVAKGYGEKDLLNKCKNGVKCDEKQHEENRRTEFKILSL
jgi:outer membrane protein OmpA-like peptidoglycan-associated protein/tetratricopeptide (TPR) repeat protein